LALRAASIATMLRAASPAALGGMAADWFRWCEMAPSL
jgi:hypothetical protein